MTERSTVVGVFENHQQAEQAISALKEAGFRDDQLGYILRGHQGSKGVVSGIVGGVMGAADAVLLPGLGPTEASAALESALPLSEAVVDRFQHPQHAQTPPAEQAQAQAIPAHDEITSAAQIHPQHMENAENIEDSSIQVTKVTGNEAEGAVGGGIVGGLVGAVAALLIPGIGPALAGGIIVTAIGGAAIGAVTGGLLGAFAGMGIPREEAHHYQRELEAGRVLVTVQANDQSAEALDILRQHGAQTVE